MKIKKLAYMGLTITLALIMSYVETFIPMPTFAPGIKLGLANLVIVFVLYKFGCKEAFFVSLLRVLIAGFMFGNMSSIIYGMVGAIFSLIVMCLIGKVLKYGVISVSICGALAHVTGQMLVAGMVTDFGIIKYYAPYLLIASFICGAIIGIISNILISRITIDTY